MSRFGARASSILLGGLALIASVVAVRTEAQGPSPVLPYTSRIEHRWDGEPYRLHRWTIPLERTRFDVVDVGMGTNLRRYLRGDVALVINGGFYGTDSQPEGLVVSGGAEQSAFLERIGGGVVSVAAGRAAQHDAEAPELGLPDGLDFAIQCRPRLVVGGQNNIASRRPATAARTALCVRDGGRGLDVYVARRDPSRGRAGPTLHTLGRVLAEEGCEEALNLDGGPSTGAAWRTRHGVRALRPHRGIRHAVLFRIER